MLRSAVMIAVGRSVLTATPFTAIGETVSALRPRSRSGAASLSTTSARSHGR